MELYNNMLHVTTTNAGFKMTKLTVRKTDTITNPSSVWTIRRFDETNDLMFNLVTVVRPIISADVARYVIRKTPFFF